VVGGTALRIGADVGVEEEELSILENCIRIGEIRFAIAQGFHLCARQTHSRFEFILDEVIVPSFAVFGNDLDAARCWRRR